MKPIVLAPTSPEITELETKNRALARQAAAEDMVLLANNGVLPLREKEIALYGAGARMTVKGGRGSGEVRNRSNVSIAQGLEKAGYSILTTAWLDAFDAYYRDTYEA
jgi:beta-glucosidase